MRALNEKALLHRDQVRLRIGYRGFKVFSGLREKKIEDMKRVRDYYVGRMKQKVMQALRDNADDCLAKETHIKKAMQFQVLRHSRYFLMLRAFRALQRWPSLRE